LAIFILEIRFLYSQIWRNSKHENKKILSTLSYFWQLRRFRLFLNFKFFSSIYSQIWRLSNIKVKKNLNQTFVFKAIVPILAIFILNSRFFVYSQI